MTRPHMAHYSSRFFPERITIRARSQSNIGSPGRRFTAATNAAFAVRKSPAVASVSRRLFHPRSQSSTLKGSSSPIRAWKNIKGTTSSRQIRPRVGLRQRELVGRTGGPRHGQSFKPGEPRRLRGLLPDRFSILESSSPAKASLYESSAGLRWHLSNRSDRIRGAPGYSHL
jgi:hypothetical protein